MIGIICGKGDLPKQLINHFEKQNKDFVCVGFKDAEPDFFNRAAFKAAIYGIGEIGSTLGFFKENGVTEIIFAGTIKRPNIFSLSLDSTGKQWFKKMGLSVLKGDDGLLRSLINLLEAEGFKVTSPKEILQDLTLSKGLYGVKTLSDIEQKDIQKGIELLEHLSVLDVGQAVVVECGLVLGVEAIEGTKALIERVAKLKRSDNHGTLIKTAKKEQTFKADLPTIGLETVISCKKAGLKGIAFDSLGTQVLDKDFVVKKAEEEQLFLYVF